MTRALPAFAAMGVGPCDSLGTTSLADAAGRAFVLSGQGLDEMPKQHRLAVAGGRAEDLHWRLAIFELVDWLSGHWTAAQAEAVATTLRHPHANHQMMANQLGITRQAMQSRLSKAGMNHLFSAVLAFQNTTWDTAL
jgi:DNA-binding NtrC family response regulator